MLHKLVWVALLVSLSACTKKEASPVRVVNLAIWSNFIATETLAQFEKEKGIQVKISNFSSNEELLAKLQAGAVGYDVAVPSDYMVLTLSELGLVQALERGKLPNFKHLDAKFLGKSFDPGNKYSVPLDWGTTGIAVNTELYKGEVRSWKDLFSKADLAGKFTLMDDVRETTGAALKSLGFSMNSKNPSELAKAKELLIANRDRIKGFSSEPRMPLIDGELAVAHVYSSDALQAARATKGKIKYVLPAEGGTFWIDALVIPKGAKNASEAYELINYLMEPSVAAAHVGHILTGPVNSAATGLLPKELQGDQALFPSPSVLKKFELFEDLGNHIEAWDRVWTEVKAGRD